MIHALKKGVLVALGKTITSLDFDCHCKDPNCQLTLADERLVDGLEAIIETTGHLIFDSGFRCISHNTLVGGLPDSQHLLGKAMDISSPDYSPYGLSRIVETIEVFFNGGVGKYADFLHVDSRNGKARWDYTTKC